MGAKTCLGGGGGTGNNCNASSADISAKTRYSLGGGGIGNSCNAASADISAKTRYSWDEWRYYNASKGKAQENRPMHLPYSSEKRYSSPKGRFNGYPNRDNKERLYLTSRNIHQAPKKPMHSIDENRVIVVLALEAPRRVAEKKMSNSSDLSEATAQGIKSKQSKVVESTTDLDLTLKL